MIHSKNLNSYSLKHSWGWRDEKIINGLINERKPKIDNIPKRIINRSKFNKYAFIQGARYGYNKIYNLYNKKIDFLESNYTNPSLSIALNYLCNKDLKKTIK